MPNGMEFLSDLELEKLVKGMNDRELMEFTARQVYDVCNLAGSNQRRIMILEKRGNKIVGIAGAIGTFIGAVISGIISFFVRN